MKPSYAGKNTPKASKPKKAEEETSLDNIPTLKEEIEKKYLALKQVDIVEVDQRLALLARVNLESILKNPNMSDEKLADLSLRTISTIEGSKSKQELWVKDETKKPTKTMEEVKQDIEKTEARLMDLFTRKRMRNQEDRAEDALGLMELGIRSDEVKDA